MGVITSYIQRQWYIGHTYSDFGRVLDGFSGTILDFNFSDFTSKDSVSPKTQHVVLKWGKLNT